MICLIVFWTMYNALGSMKKIFLLLFLTLMLSGCYSSTAFIGSAGSLASGGNMVQSTVSSAVSYGIEKKTGKNPMEHAISYTEKRNPKKKKFKCVSFLEASETEFCEIIRKNILETKEQIIKNSKIENLAKKSIINNTR